MKNTLVTSENAQIQAIIDVVGIAAMKEARFQSAKLTTAGRQRVLAQGDKFTSELMAFITTKMTEFAEQIVGYLKLISGDETIIIDETDGKDVIIDAKDVFTGSIDLNFLNYKNTKSQPTKKTKVQIFGPVKNGTFAQIFGGFGENLDRLCLTQSQTIRFVKDHSKWLRTGGYGTFFLFKENGEYFVTGVSLGVVGRLRVSHYRWSYDNVWIIKDHHRFVIPQL